MPGSGSARVYRQLLGLYPRAFRDEYGDDLVALFEEQCREERPARVYARTALDLVLTVPIRHLEVPMRHRAPATLVSIYLAIVLGGLATAVLGGTSEVAVSIGLFVAIVAGALAVVTARRTASAPTDASSRWWKLMTTGAALVAAVVLGAALGIEAWYLAWVAATSGLVLVAAGVLLGAYQLVRRRSALTT
jgi:hypothetical protein